MDDALRANELTRWKNPGYLDALAAAYAEQGDFDEALEWQRSALADPVYEKASGEAARKRMRLYEQRMPYRQERR